VKEFKDITANSIDVSTFSQGMYIVRIAFEGENAIYNKILIKE